MAKIAKFNIGEFVIHKKQGYRAMIVDIDPLFQASGRYSPHLLKRPFANQSPWYRLLVDDSNLITYVEESSLAFDTSNQEINNPNLEDYLIKEGDKYIPRRKH